MASTVFRSVILGAPGSGKGTISSRIIKNFKLEHISSGDKLRLSVQSKNELGLQVSKYIKEGKLVPDPIILKLITNEVDKVGKNNWLLDGFPRTLSQAQALWNVQPLDLVINLQVPFDIIVERVKGRMIHLPSGRVYNKDFNAPKVPGKDDVTGEDLVQRVDDKPEVVMKRLMEYDNIISPVINYYRDHGIVRDFKGNTSDEIWPNVLECLTLYIPQNVQTGSVDEAVVRDQEETMNEKMFRYQLVNVLLDRHIQQQELQYGPLPSDEVDSNSENLDSMDNNHDNNPRYYRELKSRKNSNRSPMWNQFVPSHVENMKYLISKLDISEENENSANMEEASNSKSNNQVSQSVETSTINPSTLSVSLTPSDDKLEESALNLKPFDIVQYDYDWQGDIKDFELNWGIADLF